MSDATYMTRRVRLAVLTGLLLGAGDAGWAAGTTTVSDWAVAPSFPAKGWVELPPLARVEATDDSGTTWKWRGTVPLSLDASRRDLVACLKRQGWVLDKTMVLGSGSSSQELTVLKKDKRCILLMLLQKSFGETVFYMGEDNDSEIQRVNRDNKKDRG